MRTVQIGDLKNQLSGYLKYVQSGGEVVVRDRNVPVARILPIDLATVSDDETALVASGAMRLPEREMDWEKFWALPKAKVSHRAAVEAAIESRGDR
jgi:prevent-host-death family protein